MAVGLIVCLLVLTVTADLMTDRIPNALTLTGLVAGLWHAYVRAGPSGLVSAMTAAALMFLLGLALFFLKALRGGDGKLMTALASMLGLSLSGKVLLMAMALTAAWGVPRLIKEKKSVSVHFSVPVMMATLMFMV